MPRNDNAPGADGERYAPVCFDRRELNQILNVYGAMVAAGEWRDYAIDHDTKAASFCVYRRASEVPIYRIVKKPDLARKQGLYAVIGASGQILKRGPSLSAILHVFHRRLWKVIEATG